MSRHNSIILWYITIIVFYLFSGCTKDELDYPGPRFKPFAVNDIEYAVNTNSAGDLQHLTMDIFYSQKVDTLQKFPLVLMLHGGSFQVGDKQWVSESCKILADSGFIAATINYRLGWNNNCSNDSSQTLAEACYRGMQDVNAALRYLVAHAFEYGIDTNWIFIAGESAGAIIAINSSYIAKNRINAVSPHLTQKLGGLYDAGNKYVETFSVKGICNKWGAITDTNLINENNNIPVISFHGSKDLLVPFESGYLLGCATFPVAGSACIHIETVASGGISVLYVNPNGLHQPKEFSPEFTTGKTVAFFRKIISGGVHSSLFYE